jgi:hypothetical protein
VAGGYYDIAVRDVVMSIAAFTLARLTEVNIEVPAYGVNSTIEGPKRQVTV